MNKVAPGWALGSFALLAGASGCSDPGPMYSFTPLGSYERLSEAGLYADIEGQVLAPDLIQYSVAHPLWSDDAGKERWLRLPPGTKIDSSDIDHWTLPVGAQLFKEFRRDGVLIETRLIERVADDGEGGGGREDDFWMAAFVWNEEGDDAVLAPDGALDVLGTDHDVPSMDACWRCHRGQPGGVLGLTAFQLSHEGPGANLAKLAATNRLSTMPDEPSMPAPGDAPTRDALGYLHANCGHCHGPLGVARAATNMILQVSATDQTPEDTAIHQTAVGVPGTSWVEQSDAYPQLIVPGDPGKSAVVARMMARGDDDAMPPLATEHVDPEGIAVVSAWISGL